MSQKPALLVLASTFPRWKGDTEPRFVYDLCLHLKNKFNIIILAPHTKGAKQQEVIEGLQVHRYRYAPEDLENLAYEGGITAKLKGSKLNYLILPFFFLGQWLAIIKLLKQNPVKVIHAHWLIPQGILALLAKKISKNNPAILCTSHGSDLYGLNDPVSKAIKRYVIRNVDAMTVVSSAMQDEIKKLVPNVPLPTVAPMGTDLTHLFTPDDSVYRKPNRLLFVGRLVENKGHKYLFEAMPEIIKKFPQVSLNIVGSGPKKNEFESQIIELGIENHINFLGHLSHKQLVQQYRESCIGVFPLIKEGLGLVVIEAMGCELPVIVSDIPAMQDIIIDGETGVLVTSEKPHLISEKILELIQNPKKALTVAKQGREKVVKEFSWEVSSAKYSKIIKRTGGYK